MVGGPMGGQVGYAPFPNLPSKGTSGRERSFPSAASATATGVRPAVAGHLPGCTARPLRRARLSPSERSQKRGCESAWNTRRRTPSSSTTTLAHTLHSRVDPGRRARRRQAWRTLLHPAPRMERPALASVCGNVRHRRNGEKKLTRRTPSLAPLCLSKSTHVSATAAAGHGGGVHTAHCAGNLPANSLEEHGKRGEETRGTDRGLSKKRSEREPALHTRLAAAAARRTKHRRRARGTSPSRSLACVPVVIETDSAFSVPCSVGRPPPCPPPRVPRREGRSGKHTHKKQAAAFRR